MLRKPASGRVTSYFGKRKDPFTKEVKMHWGIDFAKGNTLQIVAAAAGVVIDAKNYAGYGNTIVIRHSDHLYTLYAHLEKMSVRVGQKVPILGNLGDMGKTGRSTGVHLHFEVYTADPKKGYRYCVDPAGYLDSDEVVLRKGVAGPRVGKLQLHLNGYGAKLRVDDQFGPLTENAVKRFQQQVGLQVDGIVGPLTWKQLL